MESEQVEDRTGGSQTGGSKDILKSGQVEGRTGGSQGMERQDRRRETGQKQDREQDRKDIREAGQEEERKEWEAGQEGRA